ncbi:MAG: efflux RND transporter periplasmic adaptor subunit [Nitrosomonas halophila]
MLNLTILLLLAMLMLGGCAQGDVDPLTQKQPPWVNTVALQPDGQPLRVYSGTVRARHEIPLAFQVGGRILARHVDAGQHVTAGQLLFSLDPRDLDQAARAAAAELAATDAALATAASELKRHRQLVARDFISLQALERFELAARDAASRRAAAQAHLAQARNARAYAELRAAQAGVLIEVSGEPGQVISPGEAVAMLAQAGEREIEVFLPDGSQPPATGHVHLANGDAVRLALREVAGAADPVSRSWRARYRVMGMEAGFPLGKVVQVALQDEASETGVLAVPLGALDERSDGARIWRVLEGRAQPVPVEVVALTAEQARIRADLPAGTRIIALGTHLLTPGMPVRAR